MRHLKIEEVARHRNGIGGAPFSVVTFIWTIPGERKARKCVAVVFEAAEHVAVFDRELLGQGVIAFGGVDESHNSWRGDMFEEELREAIAKHLAAEDAAAEGR